MVVIKEIGAIVDFNKGENIGTGFELCDIVLFFVFVFFSARIKIAW